MKQRRLSLSESSFYGNTTFKKNSICLSRRGHRLAWSRIPSLLKLLNLAEVLAWGAGGRGFKSHWPQINLVPLFSPTLYRFGKYANAIFMIGDNKGGRRRR